jgi:hypothetical protein
VFRRKINMSTRTRSTYLQRDKLASFLDRSLDPDPVLSMLCTVTTDDLGPVLTTFD